MAVDIDPIGQEQLAAYATVPMVCNIHSIFTVEELDGGLGGLVLREQAVQRPYQKDYDGYSDGGPTCWPTRFDLSRWGLWIARAHNEAVGGAMVAWNTPGIHMLEGRSDLAVLWDIRVQATSRRQGVGTALFNEAARWAKTKGCRFLKIETQNVNVGACRFYARRGCFLGQIDRLAYRDHTEIADEVMLVWYLDLTR